MNNSLFKWKLGILPGFIFILGIIMRKAAGPFWLGFNSDPSYVYLFDSFRILDGKVPMIVEHPGTTVQLFGAFVLKIFNLFSAKEEIFLNMVRHPEFYLSACNFILILLFVALTWGVGVYAYRKTKDLFFAILIQSGSLQYFTVRSFITQRSVLPVPANFFPETFLMIVNLLFVFCLLRLYFESENASETLQKGFSWTVLFFGAVCALGIVTKLTFVPMALLPFLLIRGWKKKIQFLIFLIFFMLLFAFPLIPRFSKLVEWVSSLFTHTGAYGSGAEGFIDWSKFASNFIHLVSWHSVFFVVLGLSFLCGLGFISRRQRKSSINASQKNTLLFLGSALLTIFFQVFIVVKHLGPHYLVPSLALEGILLGFVYWLFKPSRTAKTIFVVGVCIAIFNLGHAYIYCRQLQTLNNLQSDFSQKVFSQKDRLILPYYRASSKEYALFFGYRRVQPYGKILKTVYPNAFFHHRGSNQLYDFYGEISFEKLKEKNSDIFLYGNAHQFGRYFKTKEIDSIDHLEYLHRLISVTSNQAIALYLMSQDLANKGKIKEAILFGLKAKERGYPDIDKYLLKLKYVYDNQLAK